MTASAASESVPTPADLARGAETGETAPRLRTAWVVAGDRIPFAKSGGAYAQASAKALLDNTTLPAKDIVKKSLEIAGELCIYTNMHHTIEVLE